MNSGLSGRRAWARTRNRGLPRVTSKSDRTNMNAGSSEEVDILKSRSRYAYAVLALALFILGSVWILNSGLTTQKYEHDVFQSRGAALKDMINRLNDIENRTNDVIEKYIQGELRSRNVFGPSNGIPESIRLDISAFSRRLAQNLDSRAAQANDLRERDVGKALELAAPPHWLDLASRRVLQQGLTGLFWPAPAMSWKGVVWVVEGQFPPYEGDAGGDAGEYRGPHISPYIDRLAEYRRSQPEQDFLSQKLRTAQDFREARAILASEWQKAWERADASLLNPPGSAISTYGVKLDLNDILAIAALALAMLQSVFFVYWSKDAAASNRLPIFPAFAAPSDPLARPAPKSLAEVLERLIWAVYLILPPAILAIGFLARYDLTIYGSKEAWSSRLFAPRHCDLSLVLDYVHLATFALVMAVTWGLTSDRRGQPIIGGQGSVDKRGVWTAIVALVLTTAIIYRWVTLALWGKYGAYWSADCSVAVVAESLFFPLVCLVTAVLAIQMRMVFMCCLSLFGLLCYLII